MFFYTKTMINRKYNGRKWKQAWWHQPPPNLPCRGGTDTIGYLIIICKHLIICDLSANRVTCISPSGENERGLMAIGWVILILYCAAGLSWFIACMLLRGGDQKSPPIHGGQGDRRERALVRANWTAGIKPWGSQKHTGVYLGFCLKGFRVGILVFVLYKSCYSVMTNPCS